MEHWWCEDADKNKRRYKITLGRYSTPMGSIPSPTVHGDKFTGIIERIYKTLCWNCYYFETNDATCEYVSVHSPLTPAVIDKILYLQESLRSPAKAVSGLSSGTIGWAND